MATAIPSARVRTQRGLLVSLASLVTALLLVAGISPAALAAPGDASLSVSVSSVTGAKQTGATLTAIRVENGLRVSSVTATETPAKSGTYDFAGLDSDGDYAIRVDTAASSTYYGGAFELDQARLVTIAAGANTLSFSLRGGSLSGKVLTSKSKAIKNVDVDLFTWDGAEWTLVKTVVSSAKGAYAFSNLEPGSYTTRFDTTRLQPSYVSVFAGGKPATGVDVVPASITAATASFVNYGTATTVNQKLAVGGKITGTVRSGSTALAGVTVRAIALTGSATTSWTAAAPLSSTATSTSKGAFSLSGLATGYYALSYSKLPADVSNSYTGLAAPTVIKVTAGKTTAATVAQTKLPSAEKLVLGAPNNQVALVAGTLTLRNADGSVADSSALESNGAATGHVGMGEYTWEINATIGGVAAMPQYGQISVGAGANQFGFDLVEDVAIDFVVAPEISETATSVGTSYTVAATSNHPSTTRLDYQWLRDGVPIFGARAANYTAGSGDLGARLSVRVTIVDLEAGMDVAATVLAGSGVITVGGQIQTGTIEIVPSTGVYAGSVLRATPSGWSVSGVRYNYQWFVGASEIDGQTSATYTVTGNETEGIRVEVTGSKPGYVTSEPLSSGDVFYDLRTATLATAPKVTAKALSGGRTQYTVSGGTWSTKPSVFEYQWRLDGQDVAGATSASYISTAATRNGATIFATVYPSKNNYSYDAVEIVASKGTRAPYDFEGGRVTISETSQTVSAEELVPAGTRLDVEAGSYGHPGTDVLPTLSYQWLRGSGSTFAAIPGATGTSYTVAAADVDKQLRVRVTGTAPAYPVPTQEIAAGVGQVSAEIANESASVAITGDQVAGGTITAKPTSDWIASGVVDTFQWYSCSDFTCTEQSQFAPIPGATAASYKIPASREGQYLGVRLIGTKAGSMPSEDSFSNIVRAWQAKTLVPLTDPTIASGLVEGKAMVGELLTSSPGIYNVSGVKLRYEWNSCPTYNMCSIDNNWWADDTALASTYTPDEYVWQLGTGQLQLWEIASKTGYPTRVTKTAIVPIVKGHPFQVVAPKFAVKGNTYTVNGGYWAPSGATPAYQWKLDNAVVAGATDRSYTRAQADAGKRLELTVVVSGGADNSTNAYGVREFNETYLVARGASVAPAPAAITGNRVGDTLVAPSQPFTTGSNAGTTTETYQWYSAGTAIKGATASTFVATSTYLKKSITVRRTFSSDNYTTTSVTSLPVVLALGGDSGGAVELSPTSGVKPGTVLTASPAGYSSAYSFAYAWQYSANGSTFSTIAKATTKTYKALASQVGGQLRATVTIKRTGYSTVAKTSAGVAVSATGVLTPIVDPVFATGDTIAAGTTLAVTAPKFATTSTVSYRWLRNGAVVPGVTTASFKVPGSNYLDELSVEVTAKSAGYDNYVTTLGPVTVVLGAAPKATKVPVLTGTIASCSTLSASPGTWSIDGATFSYQWHSVVNGAMDGETAPTFTNAGTANGEKVFVVVTANAEGFALGSVRSTDSAVLPNCAP